MKSSTTILLFLFFSLLLAKAQGEPIRYVGAKKCKKCHNTKSAKIYTSWRSSKHAKAYQSLHQASAEKKVTSLGLTGAAPGLPECLICHSVDPFAAIGSTKQFRLEDGVQCETCHGPGSLYAKKRIMEKITAEKKSGSSETALKTGFQETDKASCGTQCHRSERIHQGKSYKNPCYSPLKNIKTIMKELVNPFH